MSPLMALWMAVLAPLTAVRGVSVAPVGDRTEIIITVDGQVSVKDFTLDNPARLVLDIEGARYALPRERFVGIDRGGIRSLRASQFRASIVRVVFDLSQPVQYTVQREDGEIRVSFPNPAGAFEPWHAGAVMAAAAQPNGAARAAPPVARVAAPTTAAPGAAPAPQLVAAAREPYSAASGPYGRRAAQQSQQPRITVHFQDSPIVDVLVTFAEFSGRSIVPG
ncbi:MAG TPA: AMIN domain-containing protein, partial [Longimicrobiales bacterium]